MRELLSQIITQAAHGNPKTVVLSGDHGYALFDRIRTEKPGQFINVGIIEQTMVGLAAGLAKVGFRPIVYGLSAFVPVRVLEQIKIDVCHPELPVVFIGDGAGLVYSTLGVSHQCGEDLACLLPIPHIQIYSPADKAELKACFEEALSSRHPSYLRIGKSDRGEITRPSALTHPIPHAVVHSSLSRGVLISTGTISSLCAQLAVELGLDCISVPKLKPFPAQEIFKMLTPYQWIGVVEEHHRAGGLFSLLSQEWMLQPPVDPTHRPQWSSFSLQDHFTHTGGSYQNALSEHQLSDPLLKQRVMQEAAFVLRT